MSETTEHLVPGGLPALAALATWGAVWRAGRCAPDDVVDALVDVAPAHRVVAADPDAAAVIDLTAAEVGTGALLRAIRQAARIRLLLPSPGDTLGLTGAALGDALDQGQILVLWRSEDSDEAIGISARTVATGSMSWTVRSLGSVIRLPDRDLGEAEFLMRETIRDATAVLARLGGVESAGTPVDLRTRLAAHTLAETVDVPPQSGDRAIRVVGQTAQIAAILRVAVELRPRTGLSATGQDRADAALDDLARSVRAARMTALNAVVAESDRSPRV
ncbi:hypothetical protein [Williamsia deligens]|uniref:Uncharacterized protein n=1 Tax=Williamsia deligens TaxID=321325 RepID=A0ABW3GG41_9NOCA|nr:hypothetical protein [Williamsia deligens]